MAENTRSCHPSWRPGRLYPHDTDYPEDNSDPLVVRRWEACPVRPWSDLPRVEVTQDQFVRAARLAWLRDESFRRDTKFSSSLFRHFQGCIAEIVAAELYKAQVDEEIYEYGDGGFDFKVNDLKIDVKCTSYSDPELWVSKKKPLRADIYMCTHIESTTLTLVGAAWKQEVMAEGRTNLECYVLTRDQLRPIPQEDELFG